MESNTIMRPWTLMEDRFPEIVALHRIWDKLLTSQSAGPNTREIVENQIAAMSPVYLRHRCGAVRNVAGDDLRRVVQNLNSDMHLRCGDCDGLRLISEFERAGRSGSSGPKQASASSAIKMGKKYRTAGFGSEFEVRVYSVDSGTDLPVTVGYYNKERRTEELAHLKEDGRNLANHMYSLVEVHDPIGRLTPVSTEEVPLSERWCSSMDPGRQGFVLMGGAYYRLTWEE